MPMLEDWLRDRPGVDIVISSSWREIHQFEELVTHFSEDLQRRVLGCTPAYMSRQGGQCVYADWAPGPTGYRREAECRRWLLDNVDPRRAWVAIDDTPDLFSPNCANLVVCDPRTALTQESLAVIHQRFLATL